jgi:hypothetical protein
MTMFPNNDNVFKKVFYAGGYKSKGVEALAMSETEVRKAGAWRYAGRVLLAPLVAAATFGVGVGGFDLLKTGVDQMQTNSDVPAGTHVEQLKNGNYQFIRPTASETQTSPDGPAMPGISGNPVPLTPAEK